ncbi:MAG: nitrophenyl compound nitroreductase subunit ArsF family protein [Bryobacteraceae bacterium]
MKTRFWLLSSLVVLASISAVPSLPADRGTTSPLKLVVYYFHATQRCATCMAIESYSKEVLETRFGAQLTLGTIQWQVVDVEQPKNRHFIQEYRLVSPSVVLVRIENGKRGRWQTLDKAWTLVRKKSEFFQYMQSSISRLLEG